MRQQTDADACRVTEPRDEHEEQRVAEIAGEEQSRKFVGSRLSGWTDPDGEEGEGRKYDSPSGDQALDANPGRVVCIPETAHKGRCFHVAFAGDGGSHCAINNAALIERDRRCAPEGRLPTNNIGFAGAAE